MTLADLYMPQIERRVIGRFVFNMDPMPAPRALTDAQLEQRRVARRAQIGQTKAPNRVKR